ncbi:polyprenyl synthetase family protein [Mogibacterium timidum]|uniref:polyprenyl synthetase family protein n=1 Tax=Mogibacterium timidum TaxID=35519 RepID=UPI0023573DB8|nr:farnesyl diphosphate synthase [Mogibacterium timidum]
MHSYDEYKAIIEQHLLDYIPKIDIKARTLFDSMKYSVMSGGKRLRPVMLLAACEFSGGDIYEALPFACALEYIHTYSLIHDDLPAMDNDDLRRGNPTNHKVFGEDIAVLGGDALLNTAMEVMFRDLTYFFDDAEKLKRHSCAGLTIAKAAGVTGMIAGQVVDVENGMDDCSQEFVDFIEENKTGALIAAPVIAGLGIGGADKETIDAFTVYSRCIGKAFQISDDILDMTGSVDELGKTPGKDSHHERANFALVNGIDSARAELHTLTMSAIESIEKYETPDKKFFTDLAIKLEKRRA